MFSVNEKWEEITFNIVDVGGFNIERLPRGEYVKFFEMLKRITLIHRDSFDG